VLGALHLHAAAYGNEEPVGDAIRAR
jgi:diketogulonate reductase-like aldo/keto reductase